MDDDEAAQRDAEHKAAALHHVGPETGAGATIWAQAVRDVLVLYESARGRFTVNKADRESWERLHGSALMLVVAIDQVLKFEQRVRSLTGDAELQKARARFDAVGPDAKELRELVAHLDEYAVGKGWRQTGQQTPPLRDQYLDTLIYWTDTGYTTLVLGDKQLLDLGAAAQAATELTTVVERVRTRHLARVEREANAAFRRRHGLPPERE
jgi:hypothetical protein